MRRARTRCGFLPLMAAAAFSLSVAASLAQAAEPAAPSRAAQDTLKRFLQEHVRSRSGEDQTTRYTDAFVDLNGDGKQEIIVHLSGRGWCGSGGCPTLILTPEKFSYRVVTHITITRPPIRVLPRVSHGWRSISVWVGGGGTDPSYEAELPFDGKTYASNPSMPPARPLDDETLGQIVISSEKILFPEMMPNP